MIYHENVPDEDRRRIERAVADIERHGDSLHRAIARFISGTGLVIFVGPVAQVRGSGSVQLDDQKAAVEAVQRGGLEFREAARFVRLNIARETIDTGGRRGIEGTLVHEGKHAMDFALMLSSFSHGIERKIFNPTAYQKEYSAHLTSALYLMRRGGEYAEEGVALGLLHDQDGTFKVNRKGILARLRRNYGLTREKPGARLNTAAAPVISVPRKKWFGLF